MNWVGKCSIIIVSHSGTEQVIWRSRVRGTDKMVVLSAVVISRRLKVFCSCSFWIARDSRRNPRALYGPRDSIGSGSDSDLLR